jgi:hypothetical protein
LSGARLITDNLERISASISLSKVPSQSKYDAEDRVGRRHD